jgi:hypothetical protein
MNDCQRSAEALARAKTKGGCKNLREEVTTWRTPSASDPVGGVKDLNSDKYKNAEAPKIKLRDQSASWPTPASRDHKGATITDRYPNGFNKNLASDVASWPTPTTVDQHNAIGNGERCAKKRLLRGTAITWPTPSATEVRQGVQDRSRGKKGSQESLTTIVLKEFECNNPTGPMAPVNESNGSDSSKSAQTSPQPLKNWETPKVQMGEDCPSERRRNSPNLKSQSAQMATGKKRLNPKFVEHLMGMPLGWSLPIPIDQNDYKRWETESCHLLRLLHSASYGNE